MTHAPLVDIVHPDVARYVSSLSMELDPHVIRMATYAKEHDINWLGFEAAHWIELLTRMIGGRRVFEFGSAAGFSTYFLARAVGSEGEVHGSEIVPDLIAAQAELFATHPYRERITVHRGDGLEVLARLDGTFDLVFLDMDKPAYPAALRAAVERVRVGGLIVADNVLWSGRTALAPDPTDANTTALREFNRMAHADERLRTGIIPAGDGLSVSLRVC